MKRNEMYYQLKKEQEKNSEVYCSECKTTKRKRDFYIRLISDTEKIKDEDSEDIELPIGICKDCFMKKYFKYLDDNNGDIKKSIYKLCKEYDLPYDSKLIDTLSKSTESCSSVEIKEKSDKDFIEENYKPNTKLKIPMYYEYVYVENVQYVRIFFEGKFYNTLPNSYDFKIKIKDIIKDFDYSERDVIIYSLGKGSLYSILSELDNEINMIDDGILKGLAYKSDRKFYLKRLDK